MQAWHFTRIDNLSSIIAAARLNCDSSGTLNSNNSDPNQKQARRERQIPVEPFGCVADYVPFYFNPKSPTLFRIITGHNVPMGPTPQEDLVFFRIDFHPNQLAWVAGRSAVVSDRHPNNNGVNFAPCTLENVDRLVNWAVMADHRWNNTPDFPDRMALRQAELLIHDHVDLWSVDFRLVVINHVVRSRVVEVLRSTPWERHDILVQPSAFY
jgi:hypothetical protein